AVYSNTRIGEKPVSIVSLAIQQLRAAKLPKDARILLVGAGQTNALVGKFLKKYQYTNITVFNRTLERAEQLAEQIGGKSYRLSELNRYDEGFDCLVVCTGATKAIITPDIYAHLLQSCTASKLVIDLSIPNNVHKDTVQQHNMQYVEIENLRQCAKKNLAFRAEEVQRAKLLVDSALQEFPKLYHQRQITRAMRAVPAEIKAVKAHALNNVFKKEVEELDDNTRLLLERMLNYMEKKCISIPMKAAKEMIS
ncbi:MAG: glutamyl-tRNA reductase, partial [Bacteroidota bacterium]